MYNYQSYNPHAIRQNSFSENKEKTKWYDENECDNILNKSSEMAKKDDDNER